MELFAILDFLVHTGIFAPCLRAPAQIKKQTDASEELQQPSISFGNTEKKRPG